MTNTDGVHEKSVLRATRGASSRVLCSIYCYGGAVRTGNVARMVNWEEVDSAGVELKVCVYVRDVSADRVPEIVFLRLTTPLQLTWCSDGT